MIFDFVYDGYASLHGTPDHLVPRLQPSRLCDEPHGLSGTEVNMFGLANELANRGHIVHIHSRWTHEWSKYSTDHQSGSKGFVHYCELGVPSFDCNVVVAYHDGRPLDAWTRCLKIAHHQSYGLSPTEDKRNLADLYWTPTERVSEYHRELRGWDVYTIPNAWDYGTFHKWKPVPGRLIYTTSMERGFHRLVEAFPYIKKQVPEAHIIAFGRGGPDALRRMEEMLRSKGYSFYDGCSEKEGSEENLLMVHASRNQVLQTLATAACMAYPCDVPSPCEVWPMSVTDALATGVPVVLAPDDRIEAVFSGGACITPEVKSGSWLDSFVTCTVEMLKCPPDLNRWSGNGIRWAAPFTFKNQCDQFLAMVEKRV